MGCQKIDVREVGPRDGLQNEKKRVSAADKLEMIRRLAGCGLRSIEVTACVSPRWVPQMADHSEVIDGLGNPPAGVDYAVLVPNLRGLDAALAPSIGTVAVFTAASEEFARRNLNCSIEESLARCREVSAVAKEAGKRLRGYVSTVIACPYSGAVAPSAVASVAGRLLDMGCDEISLGDTTGVGTPKSADRMLGAALQEVPAERVAGHFHDTCGCAIANIAAALQRGVTKFDSSVAGLGGCPYAPGATGNVATEDVVYFAKEEGFDTGVDLAQLARTGLWCSELVGREYSAKAGLAALAAERPG